MKILKVGHKVAKLIAEGTKNTTWRVNDDKNLSVNDKIGIVDKVNPKDPDSWRIIGIAHVNKILEKRLGEIEPPELGKGEDFSSKSEMFEIFKKYYGPEVNEQTPVKILEFNFTPQKPLPLETIEDKNTTDLSELKIYADGGSRGNPGPSATGYVLITMDGAVISQGGDYLGVTTNNQAEYRALLSGLQEAAQRGAKYVHVYMDSLLVVNQMKGIYKVKNRELLPVFLKVQETLKSFKSTTFTHVPRELNKLADAMVNEVLDATDLHKVI